MSKRDYELTEPISLIYRFHILKKIHFPDYLLNFFNYLSKNTKNYTI